MKANQLPRRLDQLEELAQRWKVNEKVYETFRVDNCKARTETWTQKEGIKDGEWISFETPRAALAWVIEKMVLGVECQVYVDDIREIMTDDERETFDLFYPAAPGYKVMFEFRIGQSFIAEAIRLWRHCLSGVKYNEWWEATHAHIEALLQSSKMDPGSRSQRQPGKRTRKST